MRGGQIKKKKTTGTLLYDPEVLPRVHLLTTVEQDLEERKESQSSSSISQINPNDQQQDK